MALSSKATADFQLDFSETGASKVEAGLKEMLRLVQTLSGAFTTLRRAQGGADIDESQIKRAQTILNQYPKKIAFLEKELAVRRQLDQIKGDITRAGSLPPKEQAANAAETVAINTRTQAMQKAAVAARETGAAEQMAIINRTQAMQKAVRVQEEARAAGMASVFGGDRQQFERDARRQKSMVDKTIGSERETILRGLNPDQMVQYQLNKWKQTFRRVADALASFIIINTISRALTGFFRTIINSNAVMENLDARLKLMVGSGGSLKALRAEIVTLTLNTPFIIKDFADAAVSLTAFGINAQKNLLPVANWAAAIGKDLPDVALAFSKIVAGSPRTALLLSTRAINKAEFDAELKRTGDRAEALRNIIDRKFGDMAYTISKTFDGLVSNVKDAWFLIAQVIGQPLFVALKNDVAILFKTLQEPGTKAAAAALGDTLAVIYNVIKALLIPAFIILVNWGTVKFVLMIRGMINIIDTALPRFGAMIPAIAQWSTALAAVYFAYQDITRRTQDYREALLGVDDALTKSGHGSQLYIDALEKLKDKIQELNTPLVQFGVRVEDAFAGGLFGKKDVLSEVGKGHIWALLGFTTEPGESEKKFNEAKDSLKKIKDLIEEEKQLKADRDAIFAAVGDRASGKDIFDLQELAKNYAGGKELLDGMLNYAKEKLAGFANKGELHSFTARISKDVWEGLKKINAEGKGILNEMIDLISGAQTKTRKELENMSFDEAEKHYQNLIDLVARAGKGGLGGKDVAATVRGLVEALVRFDEASKGAVQDLGDLKIKHDALQVQLAELAEGERSKWASAQKALKLYAGYKAEVEKLEAGGAKTGTIKQQRQFWIESNKMDEAHIQFLQLQKTFEEERTAAENHQLEVTRGNQEKYAHMREAQVEYEYSRNADLNVLYSDRYRQLNENEDRSVENKARIRREVAKLDKMTDASGVNQIKQLTLIGQLSGEQTDLDKERLEILKRINDLPSETLGDAFVKNIRLARIEANKFHDVLADTILSATKLFAFDSFKSLIFGDGGDNKAKELADARLSLQQTREEDARAYKNAGIIQRRADETNDAYLERAQLAAQMNQLSIDEYSFKTKELEQLEKINELESQRNNVILDRLKMLGEKVFDKILDQAVGSLVSGLFSLGKGSGSTDTGTPMQDLGSGGYDGSGAPIPSLGGGVTFVVNGNIFGEKDFNNMVDGAMQKLSSRRSA